MPRPARMDLSLPSNPLIKRIYDTFLLLIVYSNIWVAGAIASLVPFVQITLGLDLDWRPTLLIFSSALVPYLLDRLADAYVQKIPDQRAQSFFKQPGSVVMFIAVSLVTAGIIYAAPTRVQLVCLGGLVPLLYGLPLFPGPSDGGLRWYRLKDIPASKAWIVCGTITYAVVAVPVAYADGTFDRAVGLVSLFLLVFVGSNSHVFDIRDIESDRHKGVLTMPVLLGAQPTRWVWTLANFGMLLVLIWGQWQGWPTPSLLVAFPATIVTVSYVWLVTPDTPRNIYNIWIDGVLFLPLVLSILSRRIG